MIDRVNPHVIITHMTKTTPTPVRRLTIPEISALQKDDVIGLRVFGTIVKGYVMQPPKMGRERTTIPGRFAPSLFFVAVAYWDARVRAWRYVHVTQASRNVLLHPGGE